MWYDLLMESMYGENVAIGSMADSGNKDKEGLGVYPGHSLQSLLILIFDAVKGIDYANEKVFAFCPGRFYFDRVAGGYCDYFGANEHFGARFE